MFGAPPEPSTPAADVPPRSRLRGVLIFEQSGALASTPCAFRFQAALEPIFESAFLKCYAIMNSGSEIGLPGRISIGFYLRKHQNRPVRPAPGRVFDLKCRSCGLACPIRIRPKSGPGGRFPDRKHYCVTKINAEIRVYSLTSLIFIAALFDHITLWWVYGNIVRHRGRLGSWSVSNTISGCILNTQSDALVHAIRFLNLILRDPVGIPF